MFESFDTPVEYEEKVKEDDKIRLVKVGKFKINNINFQYLIEYLKDEKAFLMNFIRILETERKVFSSTDDLNDLSKKEVLSVFSTVIQIIYDFKNQHEVIQAEIQVESEKKHFVYLGLIKKFFKEYEVEVLKTKSNFSIFLKKNKKIDFSFSKLFKHLKGEQ